MLSLTVVVVVMTLLQGTILYSEGKLLHHMSYEDMEDYRDHPCIRPCTSATREMVCDYNFLIERYHTLTRACWDCPNNTTDCARAHCVPGDGRSRGILTANRMMPGPAIHVCEGDTIRVRVHNRMENAEGTTIHWHGLHQHHSPHMDGVAMITQCPIPPHTAFTYVFKADPPGTQYWHAHSGLQRSDGLYGNLVIRRFPDRDPHSQAYDLDLPEHTLVIHDWWDQNVASSFSKHYHSDGSNKPDSVLINGKGLRIDQQTGKNSSTPREVLEVRQGSRYRFRVASNGIMNCPLKVSVDNHTMDIIAVDGFDVEPVTVQYFNMFAGERFDFVLTANQSIGNYLLRVQGELDCGPNFRNAHQTAILHYEGAPRNPGYWVPPPPLNGQGLNTINQRPSESILSVNQLRSVAGQMDDDPCLKRTPDRKIVLAMDFRVMDNPRFHDEELYSVEDFPLVSKRNRQTPQINNISFMFPSSPALTQFDDNPESAFCNNESLQGRNCDQELCHCIHFYHVDLGDVVELVLVDQGHIWDGANHPTHLHGHGFRVLSMDKLGRTLPAEDVLALDERGGINRNFDRPPKKDTVTIPDGGYTIVRFHADNPGMWLLHCHVEYHVEIGMAVLIQVGDVTQFPPRPHRFPTCGDWTPTGVFDDERDTSSTIFRTGQGDAASSLATGGFHQWATILLVIAMLNDAIG